MANPNYRITIPASAKPLIDLATLVYQKHQSDADKSPLKAMQTNTWETNGPKISEALQLHVQAEELRKQAENLNKKRDLLLNVVKESVKGSRDILMGIYRENPKELGNWGYEVNASVSKSKKDGGDSAE